MKKTYFITGGTGSLAKKLIEYLIQNPGPQDIQLKETNKPKGG